MGANNLLQRLKGEEGPVCALRGKMVPHDGPDGQDDGCGDNNSHEGGPEQPHLLQVGRETEPSQKNYISKSVWHFSYVAIVTSRR